MNPPKSYTLKQEDTEGGHKRWVATCMLPTRTSRRCGKQTISDDQGKAVIKMTQHQRDGRHKIER